MPTFDRYAFADYSGSKTPQQQRKHIVLAMIGAELTTAKHTRESLLLAVQDLLAESTRLGQRVIFGFDHSYSFPIGFYETVTGQDWKTWDDLLRLFEEGTDELPPLDMLPPRAWAEAANRLLGQRLGIHTGGPFWGSHFSQLKDPKFPFAERMTEPNLQKPKLHERRVVEKRCRRMKPIYKIGGAGAVGLQALYGIAYLAKLRASCKAQDIPLFCWPFDGWELPPTGHVLVEIYPTLYNQGERTDTEDAIASARWLAEQDRAETLGEWFRPVLDEPKDWERARVEGWVLGVK